MRETAGALRDTQFTTVAVGLIGQRYLGADGVEIMRGEVECHPQLRRNLAHLLTLPQQVMEVDVLNAKLLKRRDQRRILVRERKHDLEPFIGIG